MATFTLTIDTISPAFGETVRAETGEIARLLETAAHEIHSGKTTSGDLICRSGKKVGSYEYTTTAVR